MNAQAKVYANSANTVFYDQNLALVTKIHDSGEWNPHDLNQYGPGDFLGVTTGIVKALGSGFVFEIEHSYDHQYKVGGFIPISKWRPRTVNLFVREDQITTDAPPTEEEKTEAKEAAKQQQQKQLLDSLNTGAPQSATGNANQTSSGSVVVWVIMGVVLLSTLIWALFGRRKAPKSNLPEVIVVSKGNRFQSNAVPSVVPPQNPAIQ